MKTTLFTLLLLAPLLCNAYPRSQAVKHAFQRANPCPSTQALRGSCKGWVIDHRIALCVGGTDTVDNMRWMTVETAKAKDRWECRPGWEQKLQQCEETGCH